MRYQKSGFDIGDKFVYFSKYGGVTYGVVENILEVTSLESNDGVYIKRYTINRKYDSKEIHHYTKAIGKEEYSDLIKKFNKIVEHKQAR